MPRTEAVPTAPAPPIWKVEEGRAPPTGTTSASVARSAGRRRSRAGAARPGRPQKGGGQRASQASPSVSAADHAAGASRHPRSTIHHAGKENEKSSPTTSPACSRASRSR